MFVNDINGQMQYFQDTFGKIKVLSVYTLCAKRVHSTYIIIMKHVSLSLNFSKEKNYSEQHRQILLAK